MTKETITLTQREQHRANVLAQVQAGRLKRPIAAKLIGLSSRHLRRLVAAVRRQGVTALAHGNRGRPSPRRLSQTLRTRVLTLARGIYAGLNDCHLTQLLHEREGLTISRPTVQRLLRQAGLGTPRTRRPPRHRRCRDRMSQAGLLVQMDGSHHPWLQDRGPHLVLLAAIDDATGRVLGAVFRPDEDSHGYFLLLRQLLRSYGCPTAVYTDRHTVFQHSPHTPLTIAEQLQGARAHTQVGRALHDLGIRWIPASSPQAKGRIERLFGTFQDRLVAELRLARARTLTHAQRVLARFLPRYNARFARRPADPAPAWRPAPHRAAVDAICCFKYPRTVANDNTIQIEERIFQLLPGPDNRSYAHARVEVRVSLDGSHAVYNRGQRLAIRPLRTRPKLAATQMPRPRRFVPPAVTHPWRRYDETARRKQLQAQGRTFSLSS
jgi:transposase